MYNTTLKADETSDVSDGDVRGWSSWLYKSVSSVVRDGIEGSLLFLTFLHEERENVKIRSTSTPLHLPLQPDTKKMRYFEFLKSPNFIL